MSALGRWIRRRMQKTPAPAAPPQAEQAHAAHPAWVAYEPALVPSLEQMRTEGIEVLEEWFRWAEEWSMILRVYGEITRTSRLLEIGCGQGRIAFPLRYLISSAGSYDGFDIDRGKIAALQAGFEKAHPNFHFQYVDVHNTFYNPAGALQGEAFRFPYADGSFDVIYAASVFTHMAPNVAANYFREAARVLKPGGRCIFSVFLLDYYQAAAKRSLGFTHPRFNFDYPYGGFDQREFAIANPKNHEEMTAYSLRLIERLASEAGLQLQRPIVPGQWSGSTPTWVGAQDLVILEKKGRSAARPASDSAASGAAPQTVSVIIPAYNAQATLAQTLESLQAQSFRHWEAVVVNDGSTDRTAEVAERLAKQDPRIRVVNGPHAGVSAARNTGLQAATGDWLLFLDADDWIAPEHLQRLTAELLADPGLDLVHCQGAFVAVDGTVFEEPYQVQRKSPFEQFACSCVFPVHTAVVRRRSIAALGGFDTTLRTCEDWDLWQRLARTGARFAAVPEILSFYRMRPNSASMNGRQMLEDGLRVIARGHAPDERVRHPAAAYANGVPPEQLPDAQYYMAIYAAGLGLANDASGPIALLDLLGGLRRLPLDPEGVAKTLFNAVLIPLAQPPAAWHGAYPGLAGRIDAFLQALEARSGTPELARAAGIQLHRLILLHAAGPWPLTTGSAHGVKLDITRPFPRVSPPPAAERLLCFVTCAGADLGIVELPICDGQVPPEVIADAVAAELAWPILGRFFERTLGHPPAAHDATGWTTFLQQLLGEEAWSDAQFYEPGTPTQPAALQRLSDNRVTVELSKPLPDLEVPGTSLHVIPTVGGAVLGVVTLPVSDQRVNAGALRAAILKETGMELCVAAVREGLLGRGFDENPAALRRRLNAAHDASRPLSPDTQGIVLGRRLPHRFSLSASRRARLPSGAAGDILEAAREANEPVVSHNGAAASTVTYEPGLLPNGAGGLANLEDGAAACAVQASGQAAAGSSAQLPILMYHRVAPDGASATVRYRVTPGVFEQHLRYLRDHGFRSVSLEQWGAAMRTRRPLPGRAVLLTFDDGYRDFLTHAWPLIKRYGFSATVFLVAEAIGGTNHWDAVDGEQVPLLGWDEIRQLQAEGVDFQSHTATHRPLIALSPTDIVKETAHAKAVLQRGLQRPVRAIAYPYGLEDGVIEHLAGACGHLYGFACLGRPAELTDKALALPRIEVMGDSTLEDLARMVGDLPAAGTP